MARFEDTFPPYVPFGSRTLQVTSPYQRGTDVAIIQSVYNLMLRTMNPPQGPMGDPIALDGIYGPQTAQAVRNIQSYFGLSVDGIVGPQTYFAFGQGVGSNVTYGGPRYGSRTLNQGDSGGDVTVLQNRLNLFRYSQQIGKPADGIFGTATANAVRQFKLDALANGDTGLEKNAVMGPGGLDASWLYTFAGGRGLGIDNRNGFDVVFIQVLLRKLGYYNGNIDGYYGAATRQAVMNFQQDESISVDGVIGPVTFYHLGLHNITSAPNPLQIAWPLLQNQGQGDSSDATGEPQGESRAPGELLGAPGDEPGSDSEGSSNLGGPAGDWDGDPRPQPERRNFRDCTITLRPQVDTLDGFQSPPMGNMELRQFRNGSLQALTTATNLPDPSYFGRRFDVYLLEFPLFPPRVMTPVGDHTYVHERMQGYGSPITGNFPVVIVPGRQSTFKAGRPVVLSGSTANCLPRNRGHCGGDRCSGCRRGWIDRGCRSRWNCDPRRRYCPPICDRSYY